MPADVLTPEQQAVIAHPFGRHARVLAVAGSGKTTTMVHRIDYLVRRRDVNPKNIQILMFNALARRQFKANLNEVGIPEHLQPQVHTFHSFSYQFIQAMLLRGVMPGTIDLWVDDKAELGRIYVHRAIEQLVFKGTIPPDSVDPDDALEAIGLWKGSLIPPVPARAGYRGSPHIPLVYEQFEQMRVKEGAITFDDFIPMTVAILESVNEVRREWCGTCDFIIVDEYQDVNYGQQRLIELLAGTRADVMVVGDDDQTIYEWRGARPSYILREFQTVFNNKPHNDYTLSHSFRFGPVLAQCAENVISFNSNRIRKPLIAHFPSNPTHLEILTDSSEQATDIHKEMAEQALAMVRECGDPRRVIVLGRMFSQLSGLEAAFLARGIPYHVLGRSPFFDRRELRVLLEYVKLAALMDQAVGPRERDLLRSIINTPNRKIGKDMVMNGMMKAQVHGSTTRQVLQDLMSGWDSPLSRGQRDRTAELLEVLDRIQERVMQQADLMAGDLLTWLVASLNYVQHFDDYYGKGESSEDRKWAVAIFCSYAQTVGLGIFDFIAHVDQLDPTQGKPEDEQIRITTVFRTKGLEYDYVLIPTCVEGYMPFLLGRGNPVYDKAGIVKEPAASEIIENERRLFYVAITRAKKGVLIGVSSPPTMGRQGKSTPTIPSRFIHEIQHAPTVAVMQPLQLLASGEPKARIDLRNGVAQYGGVKPIIQNLVTAYLPALNEHTAKKDLESIAAGHPPVRFGYPQQYTYGAGSRPRDYKVTSVKEPKWWKDEENF